MACVWGGDLIRKSLIIDFLMIWHTYIHLNFFHWRTSKLLFFPSSSSHWKSNVCFFSFSPFLLSCQIISLLFFFLLLLLFRRCLSEYGMITNNDVESSRTFSFRSESLERKTISITCNRVDNFSFRISKHARSSINTRDAYECLFSYIRDGIRLSIDNETSHSFSTSTKSNPTFPEE